MKKNFFIELMKKPNEIEYTTAYRSTLLEYSLLAGLLCLFIAGFGYIFSNDIKEIFFNTQIPSTADFGQLLTKKSLLTQDKSEQVPANTTDKIEKAPALSSELIQDTAKKGE